MQPRAAPVMRNQRRPKMSARRPEMVTITAATRFHLFLDVRGFVVWRVGEEEEGKRRVGWGRGTNEIVIQM